MATSDKSVKLRSRTDEEGSAKDSEEEASLCRVTSTGTFTPPRH
jgi:hypothetical protein